MSKWAKFADFSDGHPESEGVHFLFGVAVRVDDPVGHSVFTVGHSLFDRYRDGPAINFCLSVNPVFIVGVTHQDDVRDSLTCGQVSAEGQADFLRCIVELLLSFRCA